MSDHSPDPPNPPDPPIPANTPDPADFPIFQNSSPFNYEDVVKSLQQDATIYGRQIRPDYRKSHYNRRKRPFCCINCGKEGHVGKECQEPKTSFGIVAIKKRLPDVFIGPVKRVEKYVCPSHKQNAPDEIPDPELNSNILYLMVQRKDTMGYVDFIRGQYPENDYLKRRVIIKTQLEEMTCEERNRIALNSHDFDTLWDMIWLSQTRLYIKDFLDAKRKFEKLNIQKLLASTQCKWTQQEYGFPKGRKEKTETNIECAIREFCEETGLSFQDITLIDDGRTWEEVFIGTNGIKYKHVYYIAIVPDTCRPPNLDSPEIHQVGEISNCGWFTFGQCLKIIRPYDEAKKDLLCRIHETYDSMFQDRNFISTPFLSGLPEGSSG